MERDSLATSKHVVVGVSLAVVAFVGIWVAQAGPKMSTTSSALDEFRAEPSPTRLERGRYLVEAVAHCFECHGEQDWLHHGSLPLPGRKGVGQLVTHEAFNGEPFPEGIAAQGTEAPYAS